MSLFQLTSKWFEGKFCWWARPTFSSRRRGTTRGSDRGSSSCRRAVRARRRKSGLARTLRPPGCTASRKLPGIWSRGRNRFWVRFDLRSWLRWKEEAFLSKNGLQVATVVQDKAWGSLQLKISRPRGVCHFPGHKKGWFKCYFIWNILEQNFS